MGEEKLKIAADTNVLIRAAVQDHPHQAAQAARILREASLVAIPLPALCEYVWVLRRGYDMPVALVADSLQRLLRCDNVVVNRPAVEAGLSLLHAGGDFADGVIAHEGIRSGAERFVSFDKKAVSLLQAQGTSAQVLS